MSVTVAAAGNFVTVEELRANLDGLLFRASKGETLTVLAAGEPVASLSAPPPKPLAPKGKAGSERESFAERRHRIFGDRVTPDSQPIFDYMRQDAGSPERGTDTSVFPFPDEVAERNAP